MFLVTSNINGFFGNMQTWGREMGAGNLPVDRDRLSAVSDSDSGVASTGRSVNL